MEDEIRTQIARLDQRIDLLMELIEQSENETLQNIEGFCHALQHEITTYQEEKGYI